MKKLLAAWLCLAIAACAASHKATMAPAEAQPSAAHAGAPVIEPQTPEQKRARITALSQQISEQQTSAPTPATPMSAGSEDSSPGRLPRFPVPHRLMQFSCSSITRWTAAIATTLP